jgi:dipeptide/tripeptide permease
MDWTAPVDIYCERMDAGFWAEPINAISNLSFIVAALWAGFAARKAGVTGVMVWILITLAFLIGTGSFLFHTFANTWSALADVAPIWSFVALYALVAISIIGGVKPGRVVIGAVLVIALLVIARLTLFDGTGEPAEPRPPSRFNGSEQYAPALIAMLILSTWAMIRGTPIRYWFLGATIAFIVSLTFRTIDMAWCDHWHHGTHFMWHLLNGLVIGLLLQALIRNSQRTSTQ